MFDYQLLIQICGLTVFGAPFLLLCVLGVRTLVGRPLTERTISRSVHVAVVTGLFASLAILAIMLWTGTRHVPVDLVTWVSIPHYHFAVKLMFDRLSVPFVILTFVLCGTISAFASRYLHRERGFNRFHVLYSFFVLGMVTASLAGTIETLFAGWELVGLSSALLVAFHLERAAPVRNGLRVWTVYRISDAALLIAAVVMHHLASEGDFDKLLMNGDWPEGQALLTESQALAVGLLLLIAAAGKSALVPFSGWLPRAMEGPTPSSAVFYGALSVHLGAFLLLRVSPLLDLSFTLQAIIVALGLVTAVYAALVARVQTDIKTALSFASLTQVGIIVAEIGVGFRYVALVHILGHACLRTLQFVRAPSLLLDYYVIENAIGNLPTQTSAAWERMVPRKTTIWLYQLALERGYLDAWLDNGLAAPFLGVIRRCDALERRWVQLFTPRRAEEEEVVENALMPVDSL
jgi:NAD(P)H-quinone oxidoreductase subunit 5